MRKRRAPRPGKKFDPVNEQRIRSMLATGRTIADELEMHRRVLHFGELSERDRDTVKLRLLNTADRLGNMLAIVLDHLQRTYIPEEKYWQLMQEFDFLRGYIDRLGTGLMVERVEAIGARAARILEHYEYPLGCVFPIRHELVDLLATIANISRKNELQHNERRIIANVIGQFNELVEIEMALEIPDFGPPGSFDPLKPISTEDLALYANAA